MLPQDGIDCMRPGASPRYTPFSSPCLPHTFTSTLKLERQEPVELIQQPGLLSQKQINPQHHPPRHQSLMIVRREDTLHFGKDSPPITKCPLDFKKVTDVALQERKD